MSLMEARGSFLVSYWSMPHPSIEWKSPAEVLQGRQPRSLLPQQNSHPGSDAGSPVYAKIFGTRLRRMPGRIFKRIGTVMFLVCTDHGIWRRHSNQLQLATKTGSNRINTHTTLSTSPPAARLENRSGAATHTPVQRKKVYPQIMQKRPDRYDSCWWDTMMCIHSYVYVWNVSHRFVREKCYVWMLVC